MRRGHKITNAILSAAFCFLAVSVGISGTPESEVGIVAVGDILLDRGVRTKVERFGPGYPFEKTASILSAADLAFGNLENPLTGECNKSQKKYSFRADPEFAGMLSLAGLDVLSLANNHSLDCGKDGLRRTVEVLDKLGLRAVGATGDSASDAAFVVEVKGVRIGFAAFTAISPVGPGESYTGVYAADPESVVNVLAGLRESSDVIVASFHWGTEYSSQPNGQQTDLALLAVANGADIVLGHHPHVLQGIRVVDRGAEKRKALIAYSLGNFVFDSPVRLNRLLGESMILKLKVDKRGLASAEIVPLTIEDYRPVIAADDVKQRISARVEKLSIKFGTELREGRIILANGESTR